MRSMLADNDLTSKIGSNEAPSKPTAEFLSLFLASAVILAEFGKLAARPKSTTPSPLKEELTPTEYDSVAPSLKIPVTAMPASGIGKAKSSLASSIEKSSWDAETVASSSNSAFTS